MAEDHLAAERARQLAAVEFLEARLDELERVARAAYRPPDHTWDRYSLDGPDTGWLTLPKLTDDCDLCDTTAAHVVLQSPAYALADIASKRAVIAIYRDWKDDANVSGQLFLVIQRLTQPFADHPGYDPSWEAHHG